jgi:hypothetical protein
VLRVHKVLKVLLVDKDSKAAKAWLEYKVDRVHLTL